MKDMDEFTLKYDSIEEQLRWDYGYKEFLDDAVDKSILVSAQYLALCRKYPKLLRWKMISVFSWIWYETGAFISYKRRKFFTDYAERVLRKFGRSKIRM